MSAGRDQFLQYLLQDGGTADPVAALASDRFMSRCYGAACFLADTRPAYDLLIFVSETVPQLLRQLHRSTTRKSVTFQGQIRGRVDWPGTYKARLQNEYNPALYVCRPPLRDDDTPENQLLKFLLLAIEESIQDLAPELQEAELWTAVAERPPIPLNQRLSAIAFHVRQALNHVRLRAVAAPTAATPRHLIKARTSKTELYDLVAQLVIQYQGIVREGDWELMVSLLGHTLLLPSAQTPLGEITLRLTVAGFTQARQRAAAAQSVLARLQ